MVAAPFFLRASEFFGKGDSSPRQCMLAPRAVSSVVWPPAASRGRGSDGTRRQHRDGAAAGPLLAHGLQAAAPRHPCNSGRKGAFVLMLCFVKSLIT